MFTTGTLGSIKAIDLTSVFALYFNGIIVKRLQTLLKNEKEVMEISETSTNI